jgi:hypothetical protein
VTFPHQTFRKERKGWRSDLKIAHFLGASGEGEMTSPDLNSEDPSFLKRGIRRRAALPDVGEGIGEDEMSPDLNWNHLTRGGDRFCPDLFLRANACSGGRQWQEAL